MSADTLTDNDDAHLTVQLIYQPYITKRLDAHGCCHNDPIHVEQSAHTFAFALAVLKKVRTEAGCTQDEVALSHPQFEQAYAHLKAIFENHFMKSTTLQETDPATLHGQALKKYRGDARGAFKAWARQLLGDHSFLLAVLRYGLFEFRDLKQCAEFLVFESSKSRGDARPGGVQQPTRTKALRQQALKARRDLKEAQKFQAWHEDGHNLNWWQECQVKQLQIGNLEKKMVEANVAYGHGVGANTSFTREQAMTMEVFEKKVVAKYMGY